MSEREKKLAMITGGLLVAAVAVTGVRAVLSWASGSGAHTLALGTEGLGDLIDTLKNIDSFRADNRAIKRRLGNENMTCIDIGKVSELLKSVEQIGRQTGLRITVFDPTERPKSKPLPSVEVKVTFECVFSQLIQFLDRLERPDVPIFVRDMRADQKTEGQPQLNVTMTIVTFLVT